MRIVLMRTGAPQQVDLHQLVLECSSRRAFWERGWVQAALGVIVVLILLFGQGGAN